MVTDNRPLGADGRYLAGEEIEVEVRFSVGIQMDRFASLTLALDVGSGARAGDLPNPRGI